MAKKKKKGKGQKKKKGEGQKKKCREKPNDTTATSDAGDKERLALIEISNISQALNKQYKAGMIKKGMRVFPDVDYSEVITKPFIQQLQTKHASGLYGYEHLVNLTDEELKEMGNSDKKAKIYNIFRIRYAVESLLLCFLKLPFIEESDRFVDTSIYSIFNFTDDFNDKIKGIKEDIKNKIYGAPKDKLKEFYIDIYNQMTILDKIINHIPTERLREKIKSQRSIERSLIGIGIELQAYPTYRLTSRATSEGDPKKEIKLILKRIPNMQLPDAISCGSPTCVAEQRSAQDSDSSEDTGIKKDVLTNDTPPHPIAADTLTCIIDINTLQLQTGLVIQNTEIQDLLLKFPLVSLDESMSTVTLATTDRELVQTLLSHFTEAHRECQSDKALHEEATLQDRALMSGFFSPPHPSENLSEGKDPDADSNPKSSAAQPS